MSSDVRKEHERAEAYDRAREVCPECKGLGWVTLRVGSGFAVYKHDESCPICEGTGAN